MRNTEYEFVETDSSTVLVQLIEKYEELTGRTLQPADPDRLFISWIADIIIQERVNMNYVGNQNIPSRAIGNNLDALGKWIYNVDRKAAQSAECRVRFYVSEVQNTDIPIPKGTRVSDVSRKLVWRTKEDALIEAEASYGDVDVVCEIPGTIGNGYLAGQINTLIDIDNIIFYASCSNLATSAGGIDAESDEDYFDRMRSSLDIRSTAGARGSYAYYAKNADAGIADVKIVSPQTVSASRMLDVYENYDGSQKAFIGGDAIDESTLTVHLHAEETPSTLGTDYTVNYESGLLTIELLPTGVLWGQSIIDVSYDYDIAGRVYVYALMAGGNIADETTKAKIFNACNAEEIRPITDVVEVKDPTYINYTINVTYYVKKGFNAAFIENEIGKQIDKFVNWQSGKLGRDINPSVLQNMLMIDGVKRVVIVSPNFIKLNTGEDGRTPQVAKLTTLNIVNGGYEDE